MYYYQYSINSNNVNWAVLSVTLARVYNIHLPYNLPNLLPCCWYTIYTLMYS